jgi:hypothetical protein
MKFSNVIKGFFNDCKIEDHDSFFLESELATPNYLNFNQLISWPPNIFLILNAIIDYTDKYRLLVSPQPHFKWDKLKKEKTSEIKNFWLDFLKHQQKKGASSQFNPGELKTHIDIIFNPTSFDCNIYDLMNDVEFCESAFIMIIAIDRLFVRGINGKFDDILDLALIKRSSKIEFNKKSGPSNIQVDKENFADNLLMNGIVTQKFNTPQSGLTMNNLSQNLAFVKPSVKYELVSNKRVAVNASHNSYNILIIPWPFIIKDDFFTPSKFDVSAYNMDEYFDFFDYEPDDDFTLEHFLSYVFSALKRCGDIDLIVFPECSLSREKTELLASTLFELFGDRSPSILSGVYGKCDSIGENYALLKFISDTGDNFNEIKQSKHHRWFLNREQLRNYNLSISLDPNKKWWENISVDRRQLTVLKAGKGLTLCPLICEDLARQEPVAQAVRSIGPNLVVSLLLDGPQISPRWPGKYAAVLADDPGSSVLSVTALGMTQRSTGLGYPPSFEVALWSEPGKPSESLKVTSYTGAVVLELRVESVKMWSIDGRCEEKPVLRRETHTTIDLDSPLEPLAILKENIKESLSNRR